jgi:hypothetical protein
VEGLKNDAHIVPAKERQLVLVEGRKIGAGDAHQARRRQLEAGDDGQQGRLARARRPDQTHGLARRHLQVDAAQDIDGAGRALQSEMHVLEVDDVARRREI